MFRTAYLLCGLAVAVGLQAQPPSPPQTYSVTQTTSLLSGPGQPPWTIIIIRDGAKETIEQIPPGWPTAPNGQYTKTFYDLTARKVYTQDPSKDASEPCKVTGYAAAQPPTDLDPVAGAAQMTAGLSQMKARQTGTESIAGIPAKIMEWTAPPPAGNGRAWLSVDGNYVLKYVAMPPGAPAQTFMEVKKLSFAKPAAGFFNPPASCKVVQGYSVEAALAAQAGGPKVTAATLQIAPLRYEGVCPPPNRGRLTGTVTTDGPGTVWYNFRMGGVTFPQGPDGTLVFAKAGTMTVTREVAFTLSLSSGGGGGSGVLDAVMQDSVGNHGEPLNSESAEYNINCTGAAGGGTGSGTGSGTAGSAGPGIAPSPGGPRAASAIPAPTAGGELKLSAAAADSREVTLYWNGFGNKQWRVERKSGNEAWVPVANSNDGKATDSKIAAYGTYNYRVVSGTLTSNVITVGPPPAGFQTIVPRPDKHPDTALGRFVTPVLDANGDPAAAFVYYDPDGDGRGDDSQLMFVSWSRAAYHWKEPVFVATVGSFDPRPPMPCVSLTRDPISGTYGVAWVDPQNKIVHMALSTDGGATWSLKDAFTDSKAVAGPSLAFYGGKAHFTLQQESRSAIVYLTGAIDEDPHNWKSTVVPMLPGNNGVSRASWLALDETGAPALAYWQKANSGNPWTLTFWRPGGTPVKVTDTAPSTYPPDGVVLGFAGMQPRIALDSRLDKAQISSHYSVYSNDGGATWSKPVSIPDDGNQHLGGYMSFAAAKDGRAAFAGDVAGGNFDRMKCSWPKLARTTDLAEWNMCAPQGAQYPNLRTLWSSVIYSPSGMLYVVFQTRQTNPQQGQPAGLLIWGGR